MINPDILVIGASGNVGGELVSLLKRDRVDTRLLLRTHSSSELSQSSHLEVVRGDLADKESLDGALRGIRSVFLLTRDQPLQAKLESNLIEAAVRAGVHKVVKSSAFAAGLQPPVGYGITHYESEQQLIKSGLDWVILRPYMFMQNFLNLAQPIKSAGFVPMPLKAARIGLVDSRDVALTALKVLKTNKFDNSIHELTGPESLDIDECAEIFSCELKRKVRYRSPPYWFASLLMRLEGVSAWDIGMRKQLFQMIKEGGEEPLTDTVERITGKPPRTFQKFVRDHLVKFK